MENILSLMKKLTEYNNIILNYINNNIESLKINDIKKTNETNYELTSYILEYDKVNDMFVKTMKSNNYKTINDIQKPDDISLEDFNIIKKQFEESVKETAKRMDIYGKLVSSELNAIRKFKNISNFKKIDFKI